MTQMVIKAASFDHLIAFPMSEQKGLLGEAIKEAIEPMSDSLSEAIATIYNSSAATKLRRG